MTLRAVLVAFMLGATVSSRDIPPKVRDFYDGVKAQGECKDVLASGFYAKESLGPRKCLLPRLTFSVLTRAIHPDWDYCGDHRSDFGVIYHQGKNGQLLDMDVDCDGVQGGPADDGRCKSSTDTQTQSSFQDTLRSYDRGIKDLNANVHPYVVFGNQGKKKGYATFDPAEYGVRPLSLMAVVCNNRLLYGFWGDENGDDDKVALVGEAAISLATACFGKDAIDGDHGYDGTDVLYIAFTGDDAVLGANGAQWNATSYDEFESSIQGLGDRLVQRLGGNSSTPTNKTASGSPTVEAAATSTDSSATTIRGGRVLLFVGLGLITAIC